MPYYSSKDPYDRYALLRWWCQNQWWVQIVVPCVVCAGVIGALLYQWNNERQRQVQDKIFETQYEYDKTHPPELDPDLEEKAAAWRVIRMKKNDPSMPIPYKKKQLIVKHWKSIIVDMRPEEIQRLHDLLQDQPVKPMEDVEIDVSKFEAPWQGMVSLDDLEPPQEPAAPLPEDMPETATDQPATDQPANDNDGANVPDSPAPTDNSNSPENASVPEDAADQNPAAESAAEAPENDSDSKNEEKPVTESDNANVPEANIPENPPENVDPEEAFIPETPAEAAPAEETPANPAEPNNPKVPENAASFQPVDVPEVLEPILLDPPAEQAANGSVTPESTTPAPEPTPNQGTLADNAPLPGLDIDLSQPVQPKSAKEKRRPGRTAEKKTVSLFDDVGPLEDNFLQQREEFIKKALEERNRKIEEFKKSQDPYQFIPSPWKRNPIVI